MSELSSTYITPLLSVIVPVYNVEKYLRRCVDSILSQSFADFELILVNDGSTDSSALICKEYASNDSRVKFISQSNLGASAARNTGIEHVSAPWITFCDADDYVYPNWLQNFVNCISDDYDLLIQGFETDRLLDDSRNALKYYCEFDLDSINALISLYQNNIFGYLWVKAFRSAIIKKHQLKFDHKIFFLEDEVFVLDYLRYARRVKAISDSGYFYVVPDFVNKYNMSVDSYIYMFESINNRHNYFDGIQKYSFYRKLIGPLSDGYIIKMVKEDRKNWHFYLSRIKDLVRNNKQYHPMNPRLKQFILDSHSDRFLYIILSSYFYARKIFRK